MMHFLDQPVLPVSSIDDPGTEAYHQAANEKPVDQDWDIGRKVRLGTKGDCAEGLKRVTLGEVDKADRR